jgi:hypothetical protein
VPSTLYTSDRCPPSERTTQPAVPVNGLIASQQQLSGLTFISMHIPSSTSHPITRQLRMGVARSWQELDRRMDLNGKPGVVQHHIKERQRFIVLTDDGESVSIACDKVKAL